MRQLEMNWGILLTLFSIYGREIMFSGQIFEMEITMVPHVLKSHESENHIFNGWLVCMYVHVSLSVSVISITLKQVTTKTSDFVFYIYIICRSYLKFFMKIGQKLCVQMHRYIYSNTIQSMDRISRYLI